MVSWLHFACDRRQRTSEKRNPRTWCFSTENSEVTATGAQATNLQTKGLRKLCRPVCIAFMLCKHQGFSLPFIEVLNLKNNARSRREKRRDGPTTTPPTTAESSNFWLEYFLFAQHRNLPEEDKYREALAGLDSLRAVLVPKSRKSTRLKPKTGAEWQPGQLSAKPQWMGD